MEVVDPLKGVPPVEAPTATLPVAVRPPVPVAVGTLTGFPLLADATAYADRHDPSYELIVADWRRKLESDRFGLVAQVMATRDGCTGD